MLFLVLLVSGFGQGACEILKSDRSRVTGLDDALHQTLSTLPACPRDVRELKKALSQAGFQTSAAMVANRGRNNPVLGSFSFFETVTGPGVEDGAFFFGHFTGLAGKDIVLDQSPEVGKLLIELIVFDRAKDVFNFYEAIGTATGAEWFYRGDSTDAFKDNQLLHRQPDPSAPKFGKTMRCSACHTSGGPILKELAAPHNDWWREGRKLTFFPNVLSGEVRALMDGVADASLLADSVQTGISKLERSEPFKSFKKSLSLQERLRPLFCTVEINLVSDSTSLSLAKSELLVPARAWVSAFWGASSRAIAVPHLAYRGELTKRSVRFPETKDLDADHAWLAPIKGHSDGVQIQALVDSGLIDEEFVADVLGLDLEQALFSRVRCDLLRAVPEESPAWKADFEKALAALKTPAASQLLDSMRDPQKTRAFHEARVAAYLDGVQAKIKTPTGLAEEVTKLFEIRRAVFKNEISKNPRGQILEPGFRVIFPVAQGQ